MKGGHFRRVPQGRHMYTEVQVLLATSGEDPDLLAAMESDLAEHGSLYVMSPADEERLLGADADQTLQQMLAEEPI
jgi:hypothetical protein